MNPEGPSSLDQAVNETVEGLLTTSDIRSETSTSIVERIHDAERSSTSQSTRSHVDKEELSKVSLGVVLWEQCLDRILEGEVESLGGEVTNDVGQVTAPESLEALLLVDTCKAVTNACIPSDLS